MPCQAGSIKILIPSNYSSLKNQHKKYLSHTYLASLKDRYSKVIRSLLNRIKNKLMYEMRYYWQVKIALKIFSN